METKRNIIKEVQDERNTKHLKQKSSLLTFELKNKFFKNNGFIYLNH